MRECLRPSCVEIRVFASLSRAFHGRKWVSQIPGSQKFSCGKSLVLPRAEQRIKQNQNRVTGSA
jgi:hypothetical protein